MFAMTLDTDWVPQCVLDYALAMLADARVPATIFCTSAYTLAPSALSPLVELALHPNYLPGSTHGANEAECLAHVRALYPQAVGHRGHAYYWHSGMSGPLRAAGLRYDSSLLLPFQPHLRPNSASGITRLPVWCGDNVLMDMGATTFAPPNLNEPGMKVLNFHPIHVYMNSTTMADTRARLAHVYLPEATAAELAPLRRAGKGMETIFADALRLLRGREDTTLLRDIAS